MAIAEANKLAALKQNEVDAYRVKHVFGGNSALLVQEQSAKEFSKAMKYSKSNIIIGNKIPSAFNPYTMLDNKQPIPQEAQVEKEYRILTSCYNISIIFFDY